MTVSFDMSGVTRLANDLAKSPAFVRTQGRAFITQAAGDLRNQWRRNATSTSGLHGKHYPKSIDFRLGGNGISGIEAEVGPLSGPQSNMSFEYGSSNQDPHLDGQHALDYVGPRMLRRFDRLRVLP